MIRGKKVIAIPPGYTIKEQLEDRGLTQKELALRMEMSEKHICNLIKGEVQLTTDTAMRLENVLGISANFWIKLEGIYREKLARIESERNMDADIEIASKFPYKEMESLGWLPSEKSKEEKVYHLRNFFEVNRLGLLFEDNRLNVLCRRISETEKSDYALLAWAQKAKLEARNIKTEPINIARLGKKMNNFREMTRQEPSFFGNSLVNELSKCGVAIIFLPHIGGSFLHGATFYDGNKIVVALSLRGKDADKFWFSFFHELAHIILGHINKDYYLDMENEANEFAENVLIPENNYHDFIKKGIFDEQSVIDFSNELGIDYGIVVGRLQKDSYLKYSQLNHLKTKYIIS